MKIQVNARNRAYQFETTEGEKILYAGLSEAIGLPYECASGTCGTCKARLVSGEVIDGWPEAPGRKYLKDDDEFLMCQCAAKTDVSIEVASFVQPIEADVCVPAAMKGVISSARLLTPDVIHLQVRLNQPMEFDAGQFMLVQAPGVAGYRGWSMVNHQREAESLEFIVKKKPGGGISEWLFNTDCEGVEVDLFGPLGQATFYPSLAKNVLCIAGGSGIAGMLSILSRAAQNDYFSQYKGDVFFGVQTLKDAFFLDEFSKLRTLCGDNLNVVIALSKEEAPASALNDHPQLKFDTGYVHDVAGRHMQGGYQNVRAYLAGPPPMVDAAIRVLLQARMTTDNICYDKFS
ncbi:MAG: methanesulfonate monooxygenase [Thiobacillus sp. 63-78]|uniref:2Fe-2S iron-sulfur cluster-binding protein n=1 Tax=Thiobacillus sp. 63-78 TaxID=1895859 RepID=UPI000965D6BA|nr:2Fe-2S iron-sulfur cluster-binding protein [Thiobacillus sp. 63-78]MBN8762656.1 2Fe-2S iron-sulfur cluster binding domain-containing protein [Thiobacillus sp.]MBN8765110.1 2Fe-2S iron-sulfur cluster binding domain-containing protein [Thiobacillus sp.]MBN8774135.1 2Fe-2S iron-sulfur cluster binding domain-containing protein [Thiobacillus sp.]OJZ14597.1 MAG: methanesulfonate monooxygenase [Thiobacillus sp. 63-78]